MKAERNNKDGAKQSLHRSRGAVEVLGGFVFMAMFCISVVLLAAAVVCMIVGAEIELTIAGRAMTTLSEKCLWFFAVGAIAVGSWYGLKSLANRKAKGDITDTGGIG